MKPYDLSWQFPTVCFDGRAVNALPDSDWVPRAEMLRALGVRHLMLVGYVTIERPSFDMLEETGRVGGVLRSLGMAGDQHHGLAPTLPRPGEEADEGKPDESVVEQLVLSLRCTENLGARCLVLHAGYRDGVAIPWEERPSQWAEALARHGREGLLRRMALNLEEAARRADELGLGARLCIENADWLQDDPSLLVDLMALCPNPRIGICFDSGHAHYHGESVPDCIRRYGRRIYCTHFHDNRGARDEHMPPGFGTISWPDVVRALWEIGYDQVVNFEASPWPGLPERDGYECSLRFWRTAEFLAEKKGAGKPTGSA
jgi:sugar phosphate isomerase/epimerase